MLTIRELIKTLYNAFNQKLKKHRGNWEQNDPTADDYIKNRPFYMDDSKKVVIVPNQQITFSDYGATLTLSEIIEFIVGQSYKVKWDNVNYTCVAWDFNGIGAIGNQRLMDGPIDTGEPFIIMISKAEGVGVIRSLTTTGTHTVEVISTKIVKIDKKYLPDFAPVATSGSYNDLTDTPTIYTDVVRYDTSQSLTTSQKSVARTNIGSASLDDIAGVVKYSTAQSLTDAQKEVARTNISAVSPNEIVDVVKYTTQTLTDAQKQQVRTNIGAMDANDRYSVISGSMLAVKSYSDISTGEIIYAADLQPGVSPYGRISSNYNYFSYVNDISKTGKVAIAEFDPSISPVMHNIRLYDYIDGNFTFNTTITRIVDNYIRTLAFSPDGSLLAIGGEFTGKAKLYSVSDSNLTYISDIYMDTENTPFNGSVKTLAFSPDGSLLAIGGSFTSKAKLYSVSDSGATYLSDIYFDNLNSIFSKDITDIYFNMNGTQLFIANASTKIRNYNVYENSVRFSKEINSYNSFYIARMYFSPNEDFVICTNLSNVGKMQLYSVSDSNLTYISDIYMDTENTPFNGSVKTLAFSPDGSLLAIGGSFTSKAKLYSVSDFKVNYLCDIKASKYGLFEREVNYLNFTNDGKAIVASTSDPNMGATGHVINYYYVAYKITDDFEKRNYTVCISNSDINANTEGQVYKIVDVNKDDIIIPSVTTSDAGKFLRVSSAGTWVAESIPNAEEASF